MVWFVYLLECADRTLYCGVSPDLAARVAKHNSGKGAKYTATRLPVRLVYSEPHEDRSLAQKREYQIKQLTRTEKLALISQAKHE